MGDSFCGLPIGRLVQDAILAGGEVEYLSLFFRRRRGPIAFRTHRLLARQAEEGAFTLCYCGNHCRWFACEKKLRSSDDLHGAPRDRSAPRLRGQADYVAEWSSAATLQIPLAAPPVSSTTVSTVLSELRWLRGSQRASQWQLERCCIADCGVDLDQRFVGPSNLAQSGNHALSHCQTPCPT
jgi:hypothetical protein